MARLQLECSNCPSQRKAGKLVGPKRGKKSLLDQCLPLVAQARIEQRISNPPVGGSSPSRGILHPATFALQSQETQNPRLSRASLRHLRLKAGSAAGCQRSRRSRRSANSSCCQHSLLRAVGSCGMLRRGLRVLEGENPPSLPLHTPTMRRLLACHLKGREELLGVSRRYLGVRVRHRGCIT